MGGFMTVLGIANGVANLISPYAQNVAGYHDAKRQAEAEAIKQQMEIDRILYQADDLDWKAKQAARLAKEADEDYKIESNYLAQDFYRIRGNQRATLAQNGTLNSPTGEAVMGQRAMEEEREQERMSRKNQRSSTTLLDEYDLSRQQAERYRKTAEQTRKAYKHSNSNSVGKVNNVLGTISAANSIIGSVSSVYNMWKG